MALVRHGDGRGADRAPGRWLRLAPPRGRACAMRRHGGTLQHQRSWMPSPSVPRGDPCWAPDVAGPDRSVSSPRWLGTWQLIGPSLHGAAGAGHDESASDSLLRARRRHALVAEATPGPRPGSRPVALRRRHMDSDRSPLALGRATDDAWPAPSVRPDRSLVLLENGDAVGRSRRRRARTSLGSLPAPPAGTATVAPLADGSFDAFSVDGDATARLHAGAVGQHVDALPADDASPSPTVLFVMRPHPERPTVGPTPPSGPTSGEAT